MQGTKRSRGDEVRSASDEASDRTRGGSYEDLYAAALDAYSQRLESRGTVGSLVTAAVHPDSFYAHTPLLQRWLLGKRTPDDNPRDYMLFEIPIETVRRRFLEFSIEFNTQQLPSTYYPPPKPARIGGLAAFGTAGASTGPSPQELEGTGVFRPSLDYKTMATPRIVDQEPLDPSQYTDYQWRFWKDMAGTGRQQIEDTVRAVARHTNTSSWADLPREMR